MNASRRTFLTWMVGGMAAASGGVVLWKLIETGKPDADIVARVGPVRIEPSDLRADVLTVRLWQGRPIAGFLREGRPQVLFASCTHDRCVVGLDGARIVCPCCGVRYRLDGSVANGPAPRPLGSPPWRLDASGAIFIG